MLIPPSRVPAPANIQTDEWTCWATATSSWSMVTPSVTSYYDYELVSLFKDAQAANADGSLKPELGISLLTLMFGLQYELTRAGYSPTRVFERLQKSHLLLIYNISPNIAHTIVVHAISQQGDLHYMDPSDGTYQTRALADFRDRITVMLWRAA